MRATAYSAWLRQGLNDASFDPNQQAELIAEPRGSVDTDSQIAALDLVAGASQVDAVGVRPDELGDRQRLEHAVAPRDIQPIGAGRRPPSGIARSRRGSVGALVTRLNFRQWA